LLLLLLLSGDTMILLLLLLLSIDTMILLLLLLLSIDTMILLLLLLFDLPCGCCCCRSIYLLSIDLPAVDRSLSSCCRLISINSLIAVDTPSIDVSSAAVVVIGRSSSSGYAVNRRICCQFLYRSSYFLLLLPVEEINKLPYTVDTPSIDLPAVVVDQSRLV
jgi:hypothetical protein